ncbi:AMP-binding protein [Nocardia brasiliensis]|uniref:Putative non-ribosomal peptide synthetase n=1 Tax=Nocardia brasiliensis (strain ATCC 700358 / HUJEG-1) TaxID=1133849 RepID=K0EHT9_NOCB7|nr:AMP-binding protein [Nocardia brasiliensis]AFT98827.1 putative non-ribosomal peptide synthetase [Nocardia brasiliensis ATCC 700358]OCF84669.1 peptide synthetase [Nocardia brasiliensis]
MSTEILDVVALSPLQRGLYSVSTMSGEVDPYLVTFAARIDDLVDLPGLRVAFDAVLQRYPHLGAAVLTDGLPHPVLVITSDGRIGWREVDLRETADPEAAAQQLYWDEGRVRIDLDNGPLFRVTVARVAEHSYELICTAHHIVVDGWSIPLIFADLIALYGGGGSALPPAPPLREHAAWLATRDTAASIAAWTEALAGLSPMPMLAPPAPGDIPVLGTAEFDRAETELVANWARSQGITMNTVCQMAWARVLSGLTGRDDVVFGQTTSGRDASLPHADRLVGALVTTIPVRVRMDERSPARIGAELQRTVAQLRAHEYLGIAEITKHADAGQLFDTLLVFENTPLGEITTSMQLTGGATMRPRRIDSPSHYPIAVVPVLEDQRLITRVEIRPDLVDRFDPDQLARRVLAVIRRLVDAERGCDVDLLLAGEPAALTVAPQSPVPYASVPAALLAAADRAAEQVAVVDAAGEQSFTEFGSAVQTLAAGLRAAGVRPGAAVAVVLPRDRRVLHAPFAIGLAGALCVHVDPATPADRLAYMFEAANVGVVLGDESLADTLRLVREQGREFVHAVPDDSGVLRVLGASGPVEANVPVPQQDRNAPCYVVFTSGTTGRPKGVVVPHGALLNHWSNHERRIFAPLAAQSGRQLRIGHGWSTGFDAAWQPTVALLSGHTVVLLGDKERTDAEQIVAAIEQQRIDIFDTSPSMLNRLIAAGLFTPSPDPSEPAGESCPLLVLALGGEAISQDTWTRLRRLPTTRVINFYGPTETTVEALMADVHEHAAPTIGRTFDNLAAEVLDHRLRPVPPGGHGELYLSGAQLALGYLGRPATTAAAFVAGGGGRRYRTGDLVRRTAAGTVVYEGRIDSQVKINGYRVEPDEATVVLRELDGVTHAAALAFVENGRTRLGALVVAERSVAEIRAALAQRLPRFLVPTRIVHVEQIPLNRNDKLDVHAATALLHAPVTDAVVAEPATETERTLLGLIAAMGEGRTAAVGVLDNLADLGIDSIGIIDLVSRLRGAGYRVTAKDVVAAGDLRELASKLDTAATDDVAEAAHTPAGTVLALTALAHEIIANGDYRYLAQSQVITLPDDATVELVVARLHALAAAHPTLRSRLDTETHGTPVLIVEESIDAATCSVLTDTAADPAARLAETVDRLDPAAGRMLAATVLDGGPGRRRLLLSIHHLAVDVVSWLILVDDLRRLEQGEPPLNEQPREAEPAAAPAAPLPILGTALGGRLTDPATDRAGKVIQRVRELGPEPTERFLARCAETGIPLEDMLILACARTFADSADAAGRVALTRESHGRPAEDDTRQVGWFTVEETVLVPVTDLGGWTPDAGPLPLAERTLAARGQLRLNHLGRFDVLSFGSGPWTPAPLAEFTAEFGVAGHPDLPVRFTVDVMTAVVPRDGRPSLVAQFDVNSAVLDEADTDVRVDRWAAVLTELTAG